MFKKGLYTIVSNQPLTKTIYKMVLQGDTCYITAPGQFVEIEIPNKFLRRPISVCDYDKDSITLIYKVIGEGTSFMSTLLPNNTLDLLTGLGNGFNTDIPQKQPLLIGGGVGIPPLFSLAKLRKSFVKGVRCNHMIGNKRRQVRFHPNRSHTWATAAMRNTESFMQVHV